jgi:hypothetical protein
VPKDPTGDPKKRMVTFRGVRMTEEEARAVMSVRSSFAKGDARERGDRPVPLDLGLLENRHLQYTNFKGQPAAKYRKQYNAIRALQAKAAAKVRAGQAAAGVVPVAAAAPTAAVTVVPAAVPAAIPAAPVNAFGTLLVGSPALPAPVVSGSGAVAAPVINNITHMIRRVPRPAAP